MHKLIMGEGIYVHKNNNNSDNRKSNLVPIRNYHNDGKIFLNGYIAIYMPEHERAFDNGCVYEHIIIAEKMLSRKLKPGECVHHKDKNRTNNSPDNLMIFKTNEDHIAYHGGAELIVDDEGVYSCIRVFEKYVYYYNNRTRYDIDAGVIDVGSIYVRHASQMDKCPICNINYKFKKYQMCIKCRREKQQEHIPSKEELEKVIYDIPFTQIGKKYGVTDNAVRKWCRKYGLPSTRNEIKQIKKENNTI